MDQTTSILTLPSFNNYGGVLQGYALQQVLLRLGVQNRQIAYLPHYLASWFDRQGKRTKLQWWLTLGKMIIGSRSQQMPDYLVSMFFMHFRKKFMATYSLNTQRSELSGLSENRGFIVGSDQVWRCAYARPSESVPFFFLSFASKEQRQRSIAYAASFGSDEWEGTPEETEECSRLLKEFRAVSVREHSGLNICHNTFGVKAEQMPDPTLLLDASDYDKLIRTNWLRRRPDNGIATYLLDASESHQTITETARILNLHTYELLPKYNAEKATYRLPLTIPQWLRSIRESKYLITDSFHGCAFAIIFNKPFVCLGNAARGTARFDSLLGTYDLQRQLLTSNEPEAIANLLQQPIDWESVNSIRRNEQRRAFQFLRDNLKTN